MTHIVQYKNDYSLSYTEYGDPSGYPVLIQHGLIASIQPTHLFDRLLKLGTRLICIARPGYGDSSPYILKNIGEWADIVSVLIDHLELAQFDILGMSSGAPYSYAIGCKFPAKVRNIFILSGIPAMYADEVLAFWPWEVKKDARIAEMQKLAYELFFSHCSPADLQNDDIKDSLRNDCFGLAQDFKLRCVDWGFNCSDVKPHVWMRHSRADDSVPFVTAEITSRLLANCTLDIRETDVHFSNEVLDEFIRTVMAGWYAS
jgi:pimeloyl-ACP methyl ester carboxylesterase